MRWVLDNHSDVVGFPDWIGILASLPSAKGLYPSLDHTSWPLPGGVRTYGDGADEADGTDGPGADGPGADGADGPFPVAEGWVLVMVT